MALPYIISHRRNSLNTSKNSQYFIKIVQNNTIDLGDICDEIEKESSLSAADVYATAVALQNKIIQHLEKGNCVNLEYLGRFSMGAKAKAHENKADISVNDVTKFHINYQPSSKIKKWLKQKFALKKSRNHQE